MNWSITGWRSMAGASGTEGRRRLTPGPCSRGLPDGDCGCRAAVSRAYGGLVAAGLPEGNALDAAVRVYRYHHPEQPVDRARTLIESWVFAGPVH